MNYKSSGGNDKGYVDKTDKIRRERRRQKQSEHQKRKNHRDYHPGRQKHGDDGNSYYGEDFKEDYEEYEDV